MFFHELYRGNRADQVPFVRFPQHSPESAKGVVGVSWRASNSERGYVVRSDVIQSPARHARFLEQSPANAVIPSGWLLGWPIRGQGEQPREEALGEVAEFRGLLRARRLSSTLHQLCQY